MLNMTDHVLGLRPGFRRSVPLQVSSEMRALLGLTARQDNVICC